jgi:hypothetical protein
VSSTAGLSSGLRNLFNGLLGCLYYCLQAGQRFDPTKAFGMAEQVAA